MQGRNSPSRSACARACAAPVSWCALLAALTIPAASAAPDHPDPAAAALPPSGMFVLDGSCVVDVGELRVNVTNYGLIGSQYSAGYTFSHAPSGEWPGGTGNEYLWGAGLWVGAQRGGTISVTTGQFERELLPSDHVRDTIYEARGSIVRRPFELAYPTGRRLPASGDDDDNDGNRDEDPLNGVDDDGDGRVDEDFGQIGDQMFTCTMHDNQRLAGELYPDHRPLGLKVVQTASGWDRGMHEHIVALDYEITNAGYQDLHEIYLGFYVDCDIQRRGDGAAQPDDLAGSFSGIVRAQDGYYYRVEMGYMWDAAEEDPLPGYFGVLLADHDTAFDGITAPFAAKISSFQIFATQATVQQDGEPLSDNDRYYLMSRKSKDRNRHPDEEADYKFLMSSGPFDPLKVGDSLQYNLALVAGDGMDGLLRHAVEAARLYAGRWFNKDGLGWTGYGGRETLVCLGDYPKPPFGMDPILGQRYSFMDDSCTGDYPIIGFSILREEDLIEYPDGSLCAWVNMDNCEECLRYNGFECDPATFHATYGRFRTGVGGREAHYRWTLSTESPPAAPAARVSPRDRRVEVFWDNRSELDADPLRGVIDFESYRIWRVEEWTPPGDLRDDSLPPVASWGLVGEFDLINEIPAGVGGSTSAIALGRNTGLEIAAYEPACLLEERFAGAAAAMQAIVDADPQGTWLTRPPLRQHDGSVTPGMAELVRWETHPAVLDTFFAVTVREADEAAGIVGKPAVRYYRFIDDGLQNGLPYYHAVTARDHRLVETEAGWAPAGHGIEADPSNHAQRSVPRPDGQTVAERSREGNNIYVYPNPATRESLAEFTPREPSNADPTGVRVVFNNLPLAHNTIRIYTVAGDLLETVHHDGFRQGGAATWNLMTRNGQEVVSGVYLYAVHSDEDGFEPFRGRFVVIR